MGEVGDGKGGLRGEGEGGEARRVGDGGAETKYIWMILRLTWREGAVRSQAQAQSSRGLWPKQLKNTVSGQKRSVSSRYVQVR